MRGNRSSLFITSIAAVALLAATAHAATTGSDNAAGYSGANNWAPANGGTGFGAWTFDNGGTVNETGNFIGSSTSNGGTGGGTNGSSLGIDTSGNAWGLYANTSLTADAIRPFTGTLSIGQTVSIDIDQGFQGNPSTVGIGLQNGAGSNLVEVYYVGGDAVNSWKVNDNGGQANLSPNVGFTSNGLHLSLTLTSATTYSATLSGLNGDSDSASFSGTLDSQSDEGIAQIRLFNFNAGGGSASDAFFNNLAVVPEPSTVALVGLSLLGALTFRRRKH
jgi:PEP-CTERM motif-containing protein